MSKPVQGDGHAVFRVFGLATFTLAMGAASCVPRYEPPTADQPHALLKLRRHYVPGRGEFLSEQFRLEGKRIFDARKSAQLATGPQMDTVLVHPARTKLEGKFSFTHDEWRMVNESYPCGYGRMCWRPMNRRVTVTDSTCKAALGVQLQVGHIYLAELDSLDRNQCTLSCYEQIPREGDTFKNIPCQTFPLE